MLIQLSNHRIYDSDYAAQYEEIYILPWMRKHMINMQIVQMLLARNDFDEAVWLDTCCGQGWHFSQLESAVTMIGIDSSAAQLSHAARRNPKARLICCDIRQLSIREASVSLVTNFWGSYCYLPREEEIQAFVEACCKAVGPKGALYFEILTAEGVATFNTSSFSRDHAFFVSPIEEDYRRWQYTDSGGTHVMLSPPLDLFMPIAKTYFSMVRCFNDGAFMHHLVCEK